MKHRDDEELKSYLRQFRPLHAEPLPVTQAQAAHKPRRLALWAGAAAVFVIAAVLAFRLLPNQHPDSPESASATRIDNPQPLTVYTANQILSRASSTKTALDDIAFQAQTVPASQGTQSALKVLSNEDRL